MGIQTTYKCDNNGCGKTTQELEGWFGVATQEKPGYGIQTCATLFHYGLGSDFGDVGGDEALACSESCALSMIQRHMAANRPSKGTPTQ